MPKKSNLQRSFDDNAVAAVKIYHQTQQPCIKILLPKGADYEYCRQRLLDLSPDFESHLSKFGHAYILVRSTAAAKFAQHYNKAAQDSPHDATAAAPVQPRLERQKELGAGTFGKVFLALQQPGDKEVALKVPKDGIALTHEANILKDLNHPNVVQLLATSGDGSLVLELVRGGSLADWRRSTAPKSASHKSSIAKAIAAGLAYLRRCRVMHRDLKPANILLTEEPVAKIADFGAAGKLGDTETTLQTHRRIGTLRYTPPESMAPNQQGNYTQSFSGDIYAFGVTLWEMLREQAFSAGVVRDDDDTKFINAIREGNRRRIPQGTPEALTDLIEECWHKDPTERPTAELIQKNFEINRVSFEVSAGAGAEANASLPTCS